jgi:hypothetical protein
VIEMRNGMRTSARPALWLSLLLLVGAGCESRQRSTSDSSSTRAEEQAAAPVDSPSRGTRPKTSPEIAYVVIAPEISEETPVVERRLPPAAGRPTFLRNDTLFAAVLDLIPILKPGARVGLSDRAVVVNGRRLPVTGLEQNGVVYVPVKAFAKEFGAFTLVNEVDGSGTIWPHNALIYWKQHGPGNAPVLVQAAAEGLIPP